MPTITPPEDVDPIIMKNWLKNEAKYRCQLCGKRGTYSDMYNHTINCSPDKDV